MMKVELKLYFYFELPHGATYLESILLRPAVNFRKSIDTSLINSVALFPPLFALSLLIDVYIHSRVS